jgi:hypothetical protein
MVAARDRLRVLPAPNRKPRSNGSRRPTPAPSPSKVVKSSMMMSHLSRVGMSQTSIARTAPRMPHRRKLADRLVLVVPVVPQVNVAGGIAAAAAARAVVVAAAEAAVPSKHSN